jgi:haloalkane dehalogenase
MGEETSLVGRERPDWVDDQLYPFRDNWMRVDSHLIHYVDEGPRDAPVLLFVHPGPGWSFTYRYQIQHLKENFRCVAPDLPGYGLSTATNGYGFTLPEQAHVLERFVESLDLRQIVVWANDGGGPTAILALANHVNRVAGLVVGGTFGWSLKPYRMVRWPLRIFTGRIFRAVNRYTNFMAWSMGSKMALGTRTLTKAERGHYTKPFRERGSRSRPLKLFASFLDRDVQNELDHALPAFHDTPTLIEFGEKDAMTGQHWHVRWADETNTHKIYLLPNVRHFTFEGAPEATVQNFLEWWSKNGAEQTQPAKHKPKESSIPNRLLQ